MPSSTPPKRVTRPRSTKPTAVPAAPTASAAMQPVALQPAVLQPAVLQPAVFTEDTIAQRAYHLWLAEGRPDGRALEHWMQAQSELG